MFFFHTLNKNGTNIVKYASKYVTQHKSETANILNFTLRDNRSMIQSQRPLDIFNFIFPVLLQHHIIYLLCILFWGIITKTPEEVQYKLFDYNKPSTNQIFATILMMEFVKEISKSI